MQSKSNGVAVSRKEEFDVCPVCNRITYYRSVEDSASSGDSWLWTTYHHLAEAPSWEEAVCYQPSYHRARAPTSLYFR